MRPYDIIKRLLREHPFRSYDWIIARAEREWEAAKAEPRRTLRDL